MLSFALLLVPCLLLAQNNTLTPSEKQSGWILLFDGATLNNWADPSKLDPAGTAWSVTPAGEIKSSRHPAITEDLFTVRNFRDFELALDWRISPAGNSGVKYRIQNHSFVRHKLPQERFEATAERSFENPVTERPPSGQDYVIGFEYQITDNETNPDAKANGPMHSTGALYDMVGPTDAIPHPVGEWNTSRIVLKGDRVEHWLNGVKVVDTRLDSPDVLAGIAKRWGPESQVYKMLATQPKKDCPISLQNHGDEAWFRNIKIRPAP